MSSAEFEFVANVLASSQAGFDGGPASSAVISSNLDGVNTRLRALVKECGELAQKKWLGQDAKEMGLVDQWLDLKSNDLAQKEKVSKALADINVYLQDSAFLVTRTHPTLADLCVFWAVKDHVKPGMVKTHKALCRWFDQLQRSEHVRGALAGKVERIQFPLSDALAKLGKPMLHFHQIPSTVGVATAAPKGGAEKTTKGKDAKGKGAGKESAGQKVAGTEKQNKKAEKKKEKPAEAAPAPAASESDDQPDITKIEIKVGLITKCWRDESSDKLFFEEIDLGEGEPRLIASGLVAFYSDASELTNKRVLVVSNLKPKKMGPVQSNGMVMAASNEGKTKVELIEAPEGAVIGERVSFSGIDGAFEPFTPKQVEKKKVLISLFPNLKTDENCQPCWVDVSGVNHVFMTSAGPCKVPTIARGNVS